MIIAADVETMRFSDRKTIESGVCSRELMRRAGEAIFNSYQNWGNTAIFCGTGNNGGDGYVLALYINQNAGRPRLILTHEAFSGDGRFFFEKCLSQGIPYEVWSEGRDLSEFDTIADCIFGTGFHGAATGVETQCIRAINNSGKTVISADINSGLCGDSGLFDSEGGCVVSNLTVSIGFPQPGHFLGSASDVIGRLECADIGIELYGSPINIPNKYDFSDILKKRKSNSHKGSYGYVSIIGGCRQYSGAVKLSNLAAGAMRSGCGVVRLAVPQSICDYVAPYLLESTLFPIADRDGSMLFDKEAFSRLCSGSVCISCGMGWGAGQADGEQYHHYKEILTYLLTSFSGRLIIDADGINCLATLDKALIKNCCCEAVVLTPHPLEFSRLSGLSTDQILSQPIKAAKQYAAQFDGRVILLLKGSASVITDGEAVYIATEGSPGMATAGSGDVLSGVLTGLLGYNTATAKSVACGAFICGLAGSIAASEHGEISMIASDTIACIDRAIMQMTEKQ